MNEISVEKIYNLYEIFNDFNRIRILVCLDGEEMTIGKISKITKLNVTTISSQLEYLRCYKIVKKIKTENEITFKICDKYMLKIIDSIIKYIKVSKKLVK